MNWGIMWNGSACGGSLSPSVRKVYLIRCDEDVPEIHYPEQTRLLFKSSGIPRAVYLQDSYPSTAGGMGGKTGHMMLEYPENTKKVMEMAYEGIVI